MSYAPNFPPAVPPIPQNPQYNGQVPPQQQQMKGYPGQPYPPGMQNGHSNVPQQQPYGNAYQQNADKFPHPSQQPSQYIPQQASIPKPAQTPVGQPQMNHNNITQQPIPNNLNQSKPGTPLPHGQYPQPGSRPAPQAFNNAPRPDGNAAPSYPQPSQPQGFPNPGQPQQPQGFSQPQQTPQTQGFPQPGQPPQPQGFAQPGQAPHPQGFPQPGQPNQPQGFPQPGQAPQPQGFPQPGPPNPPQGFPQPGPAQAPGFPQQFAQPNFPGQPPAAPQQPGGFQQNAGPPGPFQNPTQPMGPGQFNGPPNPAFPQLGGPPGGAPGGFAPMPSYPGSNVGPQGFPQPGPPGQPGMPNLAGGMPPGQPGFATGPPGMPGPGMPGAAMPGGYPGAPQRQRLDPNMMPSAVAVMEDDAATRSGVFPTGYPQAELPPFVSTNFFAQDQGNCNPRFMRSTIYVAPQSNDILKTSQIPFAVSCSPFAKLHSNEVSPPVIDLGPGGPVRCQRCKAYMCPFMEFQDGGRRFRCPFCTATTGVEDVYFAHLDHIGRRTDIEHRPELFLGGYEFVATKQYCKNGLPPKEPAFIFMIDVSYNSIQNGMVHVLCSNLERFLKDLPRELNQPESSIRVGLATFDQAVHFYDLSSSKPSMLVVGDVGEMFVPIVDGLLLPYNQAVVGIRSVLAEIPKLFSTNKGTETLLGPVVHAGLDALKCADRSGKLFIFTSGLPTLEAPGKLKTKNDRPLLGTDKEKTALSPQCEFYTKTAEQCVKAGVTIDLFVFPNAFIDIATIGQLTAVTGGSLYKYMYFTPDKDAKRFLSDLHHDISRKIGFDCMIRLRTSAGIRPVSFLGSFYMENSTDLEIASLDEDKTFFAEIKHDDKLNENSAIIQCAVLYTSCSGQRRLRILNICLPVSSDYNQLFRLADHNTLATYLFKQAVQINREKGIKEVKEVLSSRSAHILATYREKCSENAPMGQLILPESLKLLPLIVNSILKNDSVSGGAELTVDDKAWMIEMIRSIGIPDAMRILYPKVIPVSTLEIHDPAEPFVLPPAVRASTEYLPNDKAFLIDNGIAMFLWIGLGVSEAWTTDCFDANSVAHMDTETHIIPEKDNSKSRALRTAIQMLEQEGSRTRKLFIIREKDALEPWMKKFLVEDKSCPNSMSYVDFLCHVHREIRNVLS